MTPLARERFAATAVSAYPLTTLSRIHTRHDAGIDWRARLCPGPCPRDGLGHRLRPATTKDLAEVAGGVLADLRLMPLPTGSEVAEHNREY
jgi:hypothetical protein